MKNENDEIHLGELLNLLGEGHVTDVGIEKANLIIFLQYKIR